MSMMATIRAWWGSRAPHVDVQALDPVERDALARDVGLDRDTLERIAARGPEAGRELPRMLRALSLDPESVRRSEPILMRDMSATCSTCSTVRECRTHLDRGVARAVYRHVCPNAASLAMLEAQDWWGAPSRSGT